MFDESIQIVLNIYFEKLFIEGYLYWSEGFYRVGEQFQNVINHLKQLDSALPTLFKHYKKSYKEYTYFSISTYEEIIDYLAYRTAENEYEKKTYEIRAFFHWILCTIIKSDTQRRELVENMIRNHLRIHDIRLFGKEQSKFFITMGNVNIERISNIIEYMGVIKKYAVMSEDKKVFYRGHSSLNYLLIPSIARRTKWRDNEQELCQEILLRCPQDFYHSNTHLEKLVQMQHYGLPTRLLDITYNPLVALYFACENTNLTDGEVVIITADRSQVKYASSDTVSIIASLYKFSKADQLEIFSEVRKAIKFKYSIRDFNTQTEIISRLLHEIKTEKPAFSDSIKPNDLLKNIVVAPVRTNARIIKQEGAFVVCSLSEENPNLTSMRLQTDYNSLVVLHISDKKKIRDDLDMMGFNKASLFPEIDDVADYLKNR